MNRLDETFARLRQEGRKALVIYATAGDPDARTSVSVFAGAAAAGADILEIGVPFSDPTADGPVIQEASARALGEGMTVAGALKVCAAVREQTEAAIILFGYANPFVQFGAAKFARAAKKAGADGVLIVDLPPEEDDELGTALADTGLYSIRLVTPTSDHARMKRAADHGGGFLYYVSVTGVTGGQTGAVRTVKRSVNALKKLTELPVCVGFGIATPEQAAEMGNVADGIVVGSALVKRVAEYRKEAPAKVRGFVEALRRGLDGE